jgi:hypothetical protein
MIAMKYELVDMRESVCEGGPCGGLVLRWALLG